MLISHYTTAEHAMQFSCVISFFFKFNLSKAYVGLNIQKSSNGFYS